MQIVRLAGLILFVWPAFGQEEPPQRAADAVMLAQQRGAARASEAARAKEAAERTRAVRDRSDSDYSRGTRAIDKRDYEAAIQSFDRVIESNGARADGALYWKAYAQNRAGRRDQSLATLTHLEKEHPQSRWINDAKALEVEVRQAAGRPVAPEAESDEDLKLLALNSLMRSDPDRSIPIVEKLLKDPKASPRVKTNALFVLAQSRDPRALSAVASIAKGGSNPDLQMKAVEYLGAFGGQNGQLLAEIYSGSADEQIRRAVIHGYMLSRDKERLLSVAKGEKSPALRREAIHALGAMKGQAELEQLYRSETSPELKRDIVHGLMMTRDADRLLEIARSETDPAVKREAIQMLGTMRDPKVAAALTSMYQSSGDIATRQAVIEAMMIQGDAKALVEMARKETNPKLKQAIIERLSVMKSKEATDYMMEVLNK